MYEDQMLNILNIKIYVRLQFVFVIGVLVSTLAAERNFFIALIDILFSEKTHSHR